MIDSIIIRGFSKLFDNIETVSEKIVTPPVRPITIKVSEYLLWVLIKVVKLSEFTKDRKKIRE